MTKKKPKRGRGRGKKNPIRNNGYKRQLDAAKVEIARLTATLDGERRRVEMIEAQIGPYMAASERLADILDTTVVELSPCDSDNVAITEAITATRSKIHDGAFILAIEAELDTRTEQTARRDEIVAAVDKFAAQAGASVMVMMVRPGETPPRLYRVTDRDPAESVETSETPGVTWPAPVLDTPPLFDTTDPESGEGLGLVGAAEAMGAMARAPGVVGQLAALAAMAVPPEVTPEEMGALFAEMSRPDTDTDPADVVAAPHGCGAVGRGKPDQSLTETQEAPAPPGSLSPAS